MAIFRLLLLLALAACTQAKKPRLQELARNAVPQRIVVLGPSTTANIFALAQGERVMGVSDYCTTKAAQNIPRVGGLADPSLERILALHPDLVLVQGNIPRVEQLCAHNHIAFHAFTTDTLREWHQEIVWLGESLQVPELASRLQTNFDRSIESLRPSAEQKTTPSVLLVLYRREEEASGIMVAGDRGFLHELLQIVGGHNVLANSKRDYFDLNEESLIRAAPTYIFEFRTDIEAKQREALNRKTRAVWQRDFPQLPASQSGNIYTLIGKDLLLPGPAMLETARQMKEALGKSD